MKSTISTLSAVASAQNLFALNNPLIPGTDIKRCVDWSYKTVAVCVLTHFDGDLESFARESRDYLFESSFIQ